MKGLVFGKGYLGKRIADYMGYEISNHRVGDPDLLELCLKLENPDIVINAAGKTGRPNIDWCEDHKEETVFGNVVVPVLLSTKCSELGIKFVHIGSGCVYDGGNNGQGYSEEDEPNFYGPQFYAKTKIDSERILKNLPGLLLRIRMPIDDHPDERNLIDKLKKYSKLIDAQNSMTTVPHLLQAMKHLIDEDKEGIYNVVNSGTISAKEIMEMYKDIIDSAHSFEVISLDELDSMTKGKRSNCYLRNDKLRDAGFEMPEIHFAVRKCLIGYYNKLKNK